MSVGDPARDRKTEAVACLLFALAKIGLIEAVEDLLADVLAHADTGVMHGDERFRFGRGDFDADLTGLGSVADSVVEQDAEQTLQQKLIAFDGNGLVRKMPIE